MKGYVLVIFTIAIIGCHSNQNDNIKVRTTDFELGEDPKVISNEFSTVTLSQMYSTEMTKPLISLSQEANKIFSGVPYSIDRNSTRNTRKVASLLISINKNDMNTSFLEKNIFPIAIENHWKYKGKYGDSYIFCNSIQNLLEIVPPIVNGVQNNDEGYALVPQENIWNIGFFADVGGVQICLDRYNNVYE